MSGDSWIRRSRDEQPLGRRVRRAECLSEADLPPHAQSTPPDPGVSSTLQRPVNRSPSELSERGEPQQPPSGSSASEEAPRSPSRDSSLHLGLDLPSNGASLERRNEQERTSFERAPARVSRDISRPHLVEHPEI
jgi:hypothetical protein